MAILFNEPSSFLQALLYIQQGIAPYVTAVTIIMLSWKARGFFDNLVTNHITHMKEEIIEAVTAGAEEHSEQHTKIMDTIRDGNENVVNAILTLKN